MKYDHQDKKMNWSQLLSFGRLRDGRPFPYEEGRPPWQIDYDRIIFSSAFRRLQDKTQVFPLSGSDYVRTRLTHSLEVSTVAKSLGTAAGKVILERWGDEDYYGTDKQLRDVLSPSDIGTIVATGALAHDIGNPPFGHSGEDAIRYWFENSPVAAEVRKSLTEQQKTDFVHWEGNAQGFRILARREMARNGGGLRLTYAALGAFVKYPTGSAALLRTPQRARRSFAKKPGFFEHERELWEEVALALGLIRQEDPSSWCRHPLAYLTEAADDICYRIVDLEDGFRLGRVSYGEIEQIFLGLTGDKAKKVLSEIPEWDTLSKVTYLRAMAFGRAIEQVTETFSMNGDSLLSGTFEGDLITAAPCAHLLKEMKEFAAKEVYSARNVLEIEAAGFEIIPGLLDAFVDAVEKVTSDSPCPKAKKLLSLVPREFLEGAQEKLLEDAAYVRLLGIVDFISGMTDSAALALFRRIKGIALPS